MSQRHFTLIEILTTVAIIAILAGMLLGGLNFASKKADVAKTQALLEELSLAFEEFKHDKGFYPPNSAHDDVKFFLDSNVFTLNLNNGRTFAFEKQGGKPYFEMQLSSSAKDADSSEAVLDSWGNPIQQQCPGDHNPQSYDLWSYGPDGQNDTADDITNW